MSVVSPRRLQHQDPKLQKLYNEIASLKAKRGTAARRPISANATSHRDSAAPVSPYGGRPASAYTTVRRSPMRSPTRPASTTALLGGGGMSASTTALLGDGAMSAVDGDGAEAPLTSASTPLLVDGVRSPGGMTGRPASAYTTVRASLNQRRHAATTSPLGSGSMSAVAAGSAEALPASASSPLLVVPMSSRSPLLVDSVRSPGGMPGAGTSQTGGASATAAVHDLLARTGSSQPRPATAAATSRSPRRDSRTSSNPGLNADSLPGGSAANSPNQKGRPATASTATRTQLASSGVASAREAEADKRSCQKTWPVLTWPELPKHSSEYGTATAHKSPLLAEEPLAVVTLSPRSQQQPSGTAPVSAGKGSLQPSGSPQPRECCYEEPQPTVPAGRDPGEFAGFSARGKDAKLRQREREEERKRIRNSPASPLPAFPSAWSAVDCKSPTAYPTPQAIYSQSRPVSAAATTRSSAAAGAERRAGPSTRASPAVPPQQRPATASAAVRSTPRARPILDSVAADDIRTKGTFRDAERMSRLASARSACDSQDLAARKRAAGKVGLTLKRLAAEVQS